MCLIMGWLALAEADDSGGSRSRKKGYGVRFSGEYIVIALAKISKISYVAHISFVNIMELR